MSYLADGASTATLSASDAYREKLRKAHASHAAVMIDNRWVRIVELADRKVLSYDEDGNVTREEVYLDVDFVACPIR
jgi:hypothetical protein